MKKTDNSKVECNQVKFKETTVKVMDFVRNLHDCLLDSDDIIKEKYSGDIMELKNSNTFADTKDRIDFCIQFIQWIMASEFINKSTKDYIRAHNGSLRDFFNKNVLLILLPSLIFFFIGFIDDYLKKKSYKGLSALLRAVIEIITSFIFLYFLSVNEYVFHLPFNNYIYLGGLLFLLIPFIIFGTKNALNGSLKNERRNNLSEI